ncbi:MAG: DUF2975 domain-containing protein [Acholeplasmatales bacterium]|nr:MAG: DUF2975 domain-containing protein [Acholeplasmatales bacterium]
MFSYNEKRFETVFKLATVLTRIIKILSMVVLGFIGLIALVVPFVPKRLLTFDLSGVEMLPIELMNVQINIPNTVFGDEIMIKWSVFSVLIAAGFLVAFAVVILHLLGKILDDVGIKQPFSEANVQRLFQMAVVFMAAGVVLPGIMFVAAWQVVRALAIDATFNYSLQVEWIFMGLLIYLLASIFQYGKQLQDEVDQTV